LKTWTKGKEKIETDVYDEAGALTSISPEIEELREGKFSISIPEMRGFRAGIYTIETKLTRNGKTYVQESEFAWGLISLNTKKSDSSYVGNVKVRLLRARPVQSVVAGDS